MRSMAAAIGLVLAARLLMPAEAQAQAAPSGSELATSHGATDLSAQNRRTRRPPARLRIYPRDNPDDVYPRYYPGPNAVRDCTATYVQEFRPSGTVITPRMNCFWRRG